MRTTARRDGSDWVLSGTKMWITNGAIAGVAVVWARAEDGIRGFLVPAGTPGTSAARMRGKLSMCASITELILDDVRLPADVLRTAVEYASTRTQFGRPIAGFQLT
jgi:glutaryl-CoA dehydrogenase